MVTTGPAAVDTRSGVHTDDGYRYESLQRELDTEAKRSARK